MAVTLKSEIGKDNGMLAVDFRQRDGSLFEYNIQLMDDKVMGGSSASNAFLDEVSPTGVSKIVLSQLPLSARQEPLESFLTNTRPHNLKFGKSRPFLHTFSLVKS